MNKEQMRIAIAESLGLEDVHRATRRGARDADGVRLLYLFNATGGEREYSDVPNYPESLDACRKFEDKMDWIEKLIYFEQLLDTESIEDLVQVKVLDKMVCAKPEQRCIAYLKTKGLWKG